MNIGERIMKLETQLKSHCESNEQHFAIIEKKLDDFIESADMRFASKLTEKIVYGLVGIILAAFATLILFKIGWR